MLYVHSDGGPEIKEDNFFVQKFYLVLFLQYNFNEVLIARTIANLFYYNFIERVHSIANLGLQSLGLMRKRISENMEKIMQNANPNMEIRKL